MDSKTQRLIGEIDSKVNNLVRILGHGDSSPFLGSVAVGSQNSESLTSAAELLLGTIEEGQIYDVIVRGAIQISKAQRAFLMIMEAGTKLRWKAGFGLTQESLMSSNFDGSRSIIKEVVKGGEAVLRSSATGSLSDSMSSGSLLSALAVPIPIGNRIKRSSSSRNVAGLIYVDSKGMTNELNDECRDRLQQYGQLASLALENCWLYSESAGF